MNPDAATRRTVRAPRTACHGACNVRQEVRRQSLAQVTLLAVRTSAAPSWDGQSLADFVQGQWLRSTRSPSLARGCQLQLSLKLGVGSLRHRKVAALLWLRLIPPIPLKGGFVRPNNITRDYAQYQSCTLLRSSVGATSLLSAAPHNQRYV